MSDTYLMDDQELINHFKGKDLASAAVTVEDECGAIFPPETLLSSEAHTLFAIKKFVELIAEYDEPAFNLTVGAGHTYLFTPTRVGTFHERLNEFLAVYRPDYVYAEHPKAFFKSCMAVGLLAEDGSNPTSFDISMVPAVLARKMNELVACIRSETQSLWFRRMPVVRRHEADCKLDGIRAYTLGLIGSYAKLLVVRLDLSYRKEVLSKVDSNLFFRHMRQFARWKSSNPAFKFQVGGVWATHHGEERGYHAHIALIFNGNRVQRAWHKAQEIGKYWNNAITNGLGSFYNCHRDLKKYKHLGIGMVQRRDTVKIGNTIRTLQYLAKDRQNMLGRPAGRRTFGTGFSSSKRRQLKRDPGRGAK